MFNLVSAITVVIRMIGYRSALYDLARVNNGLGVNVGFRVAMFLIWLSFVVWVEQGIYASEFINPLIESQKKEGRHVTVSR
jgi:hypothetical protein